MSQEGQPSLLARIRALSERIQEYRYRFDLPKGHKDRYETHGAASGFQKLRQERSVLQGKLDPIRLIATGISCRDCLHFADVDEPLCWLTGAPIPTKQMRAPGPAPCGPAAGWFKPLQVAASA